MNDIARVAGVSQSTVSIVLNGTRKNLTPETTQRVLDAVAELGYKHRPQQRRKDTYTFKNVVVIMASALPNPYYSELITSIEKAAEEEGLIAFVCDTYRNEETEERYMELAVELDVLGLIYTYVPVAVNAVQKLSQQMPVVVVGDKSNAISLDAVEFDSFNAGQLVARHLLNLGHRHIAFLSTPMNSGNIARVRRLEGLRSEMIKRGIDNCLTIQIANAEADYKNFAQGNECSIGYNQTLAVLKDHPNITALVGVNDMIAIGILNALLERGYRIPEDYSVCGFDNIYLSGIRSINLTTIDYFSTMKGRDALEILLRKRHQCTRQRTPAVVFRMEYAPELIVRGTTGVCRSAKNHLL